MKFAKLYTIKCNKSQEEIQVLYQRLIHTSESGQRTCFLNSTVEDGNDVTLSAIPMDSEESLNRAFNAITRERAEALINYEPVDTL